MNSTFIFLKRIVLPILLGIMAGILIAAGTMYLLFVQGKPVVTSFTACANAGYPVEDSFPRRCYLPDGRTFAESGSTLQSSSASLTGSGSSAFGASSTLVQVYFMNTAKDPGMLDCGNPYPVGRVVPLRKDSARTALEELLKGPTAQEKAAKYLTSLPTGVKIEKLSIVDGVASVEFSDDLENGMGGSCRVASVRAQITRTLKQFPTVRDVIISVNGRTEDVLQP